MSQAQLEALCTRLEAVASRLEGSAGASGTGASATAAAGSGAGGASAPFVSKYDDEIAPKITAWLAIAKQCGDSVAAQAALVQTAFDEHRKLLVCASSCAKPTDAELGPVLAGLSKAMSDVQAKKDNRDKAFNQLAFIAEAVQALSWVAIAPAPVPFVKEMGAAGDFYGNKVLMEFKGKDENMVSFVKNFKELIGDLAAYVKDCHTTGLSWKVGGAKASDFSGGASAPAATAAAKPAAPKPAAAKPAMGGGLFAELSKGGEVTAGLKKVDRSLMTHKNPELRASSKVEAGAIKSSAAVPPKADVALKDPVFELQGNKWVVEHQVDNSDLQIAPAKNHTVLIYKCMGKKSRTVVQVSDKANAVSIDGCTKTSVVVNNVVATIDMVNCSGCEVQILGKCPTLNIDKCSGVMVYLSKENANDIQIVSAKSSEMNVQLPPEKEEDDPVEIPIPEQFLTTVKNGKLVTETVNHSGG